MILYKGHATNYIPLEKKAFNIRKMQNINNFHDRESVIKHLIIPCRSYTIINKLATYGDLPVLDNKLKIH